MELPPRTRRIPGVRAMEALGYGTTSAHAENTSCTKSIPKTRWNYLRTRGEYDATDPREVIPEELPPRTRRIHSIGVEIGFPPVVFLLPVVVLTHVSGVVSGVTP